MNNSFPSWYKLLYYWCNVRKRTGLTIPFILGVEKDTSIEGLLTAIKSSEFDEKVIIQICYDLGEYILCFDSEHPIAHLLQGDNSLLYNDNTLESLGSFEKVVQYLSERYNPIINEQTYSKNLHSGNWEPFTNSDLELIQIALRLDIKTN